MLFSSDSLARALLLLTALGVGGHFGWQWLTSPPGPVSQLKAANPGWTVTQPRHAGLLLSDGPGEPLVLHTDDAGPLRVERVDCGQVQPLLPAWLRLPPGRTTGCARLSDAEAVAWVLNHRTPTSITALWTEGYAPLLDELKLAYWGGSSGRGHDGPASTTPGRGYRTMSYGIDPSPDRPQWQVSLLAYYDGNETVMVVTLRSPPPR